MIIQETKQTETNASQIQEFKINASSIAFEVLSKNLYSNPIKAIIRELSTNALDSHKENGNADEPFDVHIPTSLEPYFLIRDYGTGISPDNIMNVYTTFFESTKRDSNDYTGCLGLGSKTPFSYTNTFNVSSYYNGIKYTYVCMLMDGVPSITKLNEVETEENNGLEVRFNVKESDCWAFRDNATKIYTFFQVKPNINVLSFQKEKPIESDTFIAVRSEESYINKDWIFYVEQGTNIYPTSSYNIGGSLYDECSNLLNYGSATSFKQLYNIVLKAEIGDLSITPSREELHFDLKTKNAINELLRKFKADIEENYIHYRKILNFDAFVDRIQKEFELITIESKSLVKIPGHRFRTFYPLEEGHDFFGSNDKGMLVIDKFRKDELYIVEEAVLDRNYKLNKHIRQLDQTICLCTSEKLSDKLKNELIKLNEFMGYAEEVIFTTEEQFKLDNPIVKIITKKENKKENKNRKIYLKKTSNMWGGWHELEDVQSKLDSGIYILPPLEHKYKFEAINQVIESFEMFYRDVEYCSFKIISISNTSRNKLDLSKNNDIQQKLLDFMDKFINDINKYYDIKHTIVLMPENISKMRETIKLVIDRNKKLTNIKSLDTILKMINIFDISFEKDDLYEYYTVRNAVYKFDHTKQRIHRNYERTIGYKIQKYLNVYNLYKHTLFSKCSKKEFYKLLRNFDRKFKEALDK